MTRCFVARCSRSRALAFGAPRCSERDASQPCQSCTPSFLRRVSTNRVSSSSASRWEAGSRSEVGPRHSRRRELSSRRRPTWNCNSCHDCVHPHRLCVPHLRALPRTRRQKGFSGFFPPGSLFFVVAHLKRKARGADKRALHAEARLNPGERRSDRERVQELVDPVLRLCYGPCHDQRKQRRHHRGPEDADCGHQVRLVLQKALRESIAPSQTYVMFVFPAA